MSKFSENHIKSFKLHKALLTDIFTLENLVATLLITEANSHINFNSDRFCLKTGNLCCLEM